MRIFLGHVVAGIFVLFPVLFASWSIMDLLRVVTTCSAQLRYFAHFAYLWTCFGDREEMNVLISNFFCLWRILQIGSAIVFVFTRSRLVYSSPLSLLEYTKFLWWLAEPCMKTRDSMRRVRYYNEFYTKVEFFCDERLIPLFEWILKLVPHLVSE